MVFVERVRDGAIDACVICRRSGGTSAVTAIGPVADGHPLVGTTAVAADVAVVAPSAFRAVTVTRSVWPTSLAVTVSILPVAPEIARQASPVVSCRLHV